MNSCVGSQFIYAGRIYTLIKILPFTDGQYYFKLKDISTGDILFLVCLE